MPNKRKSKKKTYDGPRRHKNINKRLQLELQLTVAYGVYDDRKMRDAGKSSRKVDLEKKMSSLYLPSSNSSSKSVKEDDEENISHVDLCLKGMGKYKHLWYENSKGRRFLKPVLHNLSNKKLPVDENCINRSLLTSRTLTQIRDIEGARLWRHAKAVEANCKKALSLCTASDSPYRNYKGTFPSGTDYEDYLQWIRKQMWEKSRDTEDDDDIDPDTPVGNDGSKGEDDEEENDNDEDDDDDDDEETDSGNDDDPDAVPDGEYFKGFFAFALWGYIPPSGGECFKSWLIHTVVDKKVATGKKLGRKATRNDELKEKEVERKLDNRGSVGSVDEKYANLIIQGRNERLRQKKYKVLFEFKKFQIENNYSKMESCMDELNFLEPDDKEGRREIRERWKALSKQNDEISKEIKLLQEEEVRRHTLMETQMDVDSIANITDLTMDQGLTPKKPSNIVFISKPDNLKQNTDVDKSVTNKEKENDDDVNYNDVKALWNGDGKDDLLDEPLFPMKNIEKEGVGKLGDGMEKIMSDDEGTVNLNHDDSDDEGESNKNLQQKSVSNKTKIQEVMRETRKRLKEDSGAGKNVEKESSIDIIKKQGGGACVSKDCDFCGKHPTNHYCVEIVENSNIRFEGNLCDGVCGQAFCFECKARWGVEDTKKCVDHMPKSKSTPIAPVRSSPTNKNTMPSNQTSRKIVPRPLTSKTNKKRKCKKVAV